jgi:predicted DNA-binding antitoxin AbrB/MazE fold protein
VVANLAIKSQHAHPPTWTEIDQAITGIWHTGTRENSMSFEFEATYENGVLRPDQPLPFREHERYVLTMKSKTSRVDESYGLIRWTGETHVLRRIAEDDDFGILESP